MQFLYQESGKASGTKVAFMASVAVVLYKIAVAGVTITDPSGATVTLGAAPFPYAEAGVFLGALGAILYGKKKDETDRARLAGKP